MLSTEKYENINNNKFKTQLPSCKIMKFMSTINLF